MMRPAFYLSSISEQLKPVAGAERQRLVKYARYDLVAGRKRPGAAVVRELGVKNGGFAVRLGLGRREQARSGFVFNRTNA